MTRPTAQVIQSVYQAALKFLTPLTPKETYKTIVEEGVQLTNGDDGLLVLNEGRKLVNVYGSSLQAAKVEVRPKGYTYKSLMDNDAFVTDYNQIKDAHPSIAEDHVVSSIFVPLSYQNESKGVLIVRSKKEKIFSKEELEILKLFGSLASLSIHKMQMYVDMQKALETRDLFIAMASHELRTPLTTIDVYAQLLYIATAEQKPIQDKWVTSLYRETVRLTHLVNELLQVNQIEKGDLKYLFKKNSITQIIERAVGSFRFSHPYHRVVFNKDAVSNDTVMCDHDKILQVISNLLNNAAKFSDPQNPITISLSQNNERLTIQITDQGKGIAQKDIPKIFDQFYKGKSNKKDGMGLGLFLTKNIIEKHDGTIRVESVIQKGTMFEINLPVYER